MEISTILSLVIIASTIYWIISDRRQMAKIKAMQSIINAQTKNIQRLEQQIQTYEILKSGKIDLQIGIEGVEKTIKQLTELRNKFTNYGED